MILTTSSGIIRKKDALKNAVRKAKERKVKIKIMANVPAEIKPQLEEFAKLAELRNTSASARFCVVDGNEVVLMQMDDQLTNPAIDVGIWVRSKFFASTFEKLFEAAWQSSKPVF